MISGEMWNQSWRDFYGLRYNIFAFSKKITRYNEWDIKDIKMVVGTHNTQSGPRL